MSHSKLSPYTTMHDSTKGQCSCLANYGLKFLTLSYNVNTAIIVFMLKV